MTRAERYVEITSLLNKAGALAGADKTLADLIGDAAVMAWKRALIEAKKEGREIVGAQPTTKGPLR